MTANIQEKVDKLFSNELNDSKKLILSPKKKEPIIINKNTENNHNEKKKTDNTNKNEQNNNNEINNNIKNNIPNFSSQKNNNNIKKDNGGGMSLLGKIEVLMESMDKLFTSKEKISTNKNILNFLKNNKKEKEKFAKSLLYAKNPEKKKLDENKSKISDDLKLDLDDEDLILSRQDRRNRGKSYHVKSRFESGSCFKGILSKDSKKFKKPKFDLGKESEKKDIIEEKKEPEAEVNEDKKIEDEFNKSKYTIKKDKLNKTLINKSYCTRKILQTKVSYFDLQKELKNEKLSKILNDSLLKEDNNPSPKSKKITRGLSSKMNDTKLTKKKKKFKKFNSIVEKNESISPSKRRKTENSSLKESKLSGDKKSNLNKEKEKEKEKEKKKDNNEDSCFQSSDFLNESHSNDEHNITHKKNIPKSHKSSKHIKCLDKNDGLILKKKKSKKENCSFYDMKSRDIKSKEIDKKDLSKNSTKFLKDNLDNTKIKPFKLEEKNSLKNSSEIKIKRGNTKRKVQAPIQSSQYQISPNVNNLVILQGQENKKEKNENQNSGQKMNIINPKNFISIEYNINHGRKMDKDVEMNNNHIIINNNESNNIIYYKKDSEKKLNVIDTKSQQKISDSEINNNNITNRNNNSSKDDKTHGKKEHKKSFCLCCL